MMLIYEELGGLADAGDDILDIGTKDGRHLGGIEGSVHALDLRLDPRAEGVSYVRGDGCRLPFETGSFDYVVSNQVLEHVENKTAMVDEIRRVLRRDGTFLVSFPNRIFPANPHDLPPFFSLLPRRIGLQVARLLDAERRSYYREHVFNLSPISARRTLGARFGSVEYVTVALIRRHPGIYDDSRQGRALLSLLPLIDLVTQTKVGLAAFELLFGYSSYRCTGPVKPH